MKPGLLGKLGVEALPSPPITLIPQDISVNSETVGQRLETASLLGSSFHGEEMTQLA